MTIYDRIKMLRKHAGMSQEELAHRCGYSERSMISRIEAGSVDLPFSKIEVFANALGVDPVCSTFSKNRVIMGKARG